MSDSQKKQLVLEIFSNGISVLSATQKYPALTVICRQTMAKIVNDSIPAPDIKDLTDFFEMDFFILFEIRMLEREIKKANSDGLILSHLREYLPSFVTDNSLLKLIDYFKQNDKFRIDNGIIYENSLPKPTGTGKVDAGTQHNTVSTKDTPHKKSNALSVLNRNVPLSAFRALKDKAAFSKLYKRLLQKIERDFDKKYYIGDIVISDQEYEILCKYLSIKVKSISQMKKPMTNCPVFAVALVQIGIRKYSSNRFWPYVEEAIGFKLSPVDQTLIGTSFVNTLKNHGKYVQSETERVSSILFHTFVSNYYSRGLFELLFQYFKNDLERDIHRNDSEQMKALMDTLATKSLLSEGDGESFTDQFMEKGSRAYKLKQHTLQAISANQSHSSMRLRRFIRMIDNAFWKDSVPKNPTSRLSVLFKEWISDSEAFKFEYKRYQIGEIRNRGKKHFSTPYLFADISRSSFKLKLPAQIVREEFSNDLQWRVLCGDAEYTLDVETYPVLTGYKTEEMQLAISTSEVFGRISCEIICGDVSVRRFGNLEADNVRFFDMEGDYAPKLFRIPMCAYTPTDIKLRSPALRDCIKTSGMFRWDFEFENGDIAFLPSGKSMIVGERYNDGFAPRGKLNGCIYRDNKSNIDVYSSLPDLILTIPKNKIQGTELVVNGTRHKLGDCTYIDFDSRDAKGTRAFYLEGKQFPEICNDSLNTVAIDIPGTNVTRLYSFAYSKELRADFEGAPYVFEERGALIFPDNIQAECRNKVVEKINGENGFQFVISPELPEIEVLVGGRLLLYFTVPVFMWSIDKIEWSTRPIGEIWHTEFFKTNKLFIRSPQRVEIATDDDEDFDNDMDDHHCETAVKCSDGIWEVDMTRFRTWINRAKLTYPVNVILGGRSYKIADVYTKSFAGFCELRADYEKDLLILSCSIIGLSEHYADIINITTGAEIASKVKINDGKAIINCFPASGKYRITLFEAEADDSGFDDIDYLQFYEYETRLINRSDYSGQSLCVVGFRPVSGIQYSEKILGCVYVTSLKKTAKNEYSGLLLLNGQFTKNMAHIVFSGNDDDRNFKLYFTEVGYEDDLLDFEYDSRRHTIIRDETDVQQKMSSSERYRRFKVLYNSEYSFFGQLQDSVKVFRQEEMTEYIGSLNIEKAIQNPLSLKIEELGLSVKTYTLLKNAKLDTVFSIITMTEREFIKKCTGRYSIASKVEAASIIKDNVKEIKEVLGRIGRDFRKER